MADAAAQAAAAQTSRLGQLHTQPEPEPEPGDDWVGATASTDADAVKDWEHRLPVEVFISDTDSYAIIYHTVYLKYFERARVEFLGVRELLRLRRSEGIQLRELETRHIRFFDSGLLGDLCTVVSKILELDATRIVLEHRFMRDRDQKMLTRGVCELSFVAGSDGRTVPIPACILRGLAADSCDPSPPTPHTHAPTHHRYYLLAVYPLEPELKAMGAGRQGAAHTAERALVRVWRRCAPTLCPPRPPQPPAQRQQ